MRDSTTRSASNVSKAVRLNVEDAARSAIGRLLTCKPMRVRLVFPGTHSKHEFDIFEKDIVIGGVSTSALIVGNGSPNTAGCDRASSEILWLCLWPGNERRLHVLTDKLLAEWVIRRYAGITFPRNIEIFHYELQSDVLSKIGVLAA